MLGFAAMGAAARSPAEGYVPELDGLRALAISAVILDHAAKNWFPGGFVGVDIFFALSGYLITSLLLAEQRRNGDIDIRAFYIRRALRLCPALALVLLVYLAIAPWTEEPRRNLLNVGVSAVYMMDVLRTFWSW